MSKNLLTLLVFVLCSILCYSQKGDCYYYYNKNKIEIPINEKFIVVYPDQLIKDSLIENGYIKNVSKSFGVDGKNIMVYELCNNVNYEEITSNLRKNNGVKSVEPVIGDSLMCSNHFYVKLLQIPDTTLLKHLADSLNCNIVEAIPYCNNWYEIESLRESTTTVITKANIFYESGLFDKVDYGFIFRYSVNCVSDPMYYNQWGINTNSSYQIKACGAWAITTGNSNVKVAIFDCGIRENHEDFASNQYVCSYDAQTMTTPAEQDGHHATHLAGIIFANHNNNLGIAGIAPNISGINISTRFFVSDTLSKVLARGINYAVENNADIINNSWGDQAHDSYIHQYMHDVLLEDAIDNAIINGRNGKGCIVVFASGNCAPTMDYPGDYRPEILTVGSISSLGERASSSAYGNLLDVVAPGVNVYSTYLTYTPFQDIFYDTYDYMNGTSVAAPHASGVAALILSVNPNLTGQQVRDVIEITSQKIRDINETNGLYNYTVSSDHPNGSWNNQVGYGLIDAHRAVMYAYYCYNSNITGYSNLDLCYEYSYGIETVTLLPNTTLKWRVSDNLRIISGQNSTNVTIMPTNIGPGTITFDFIRLGDTVSITKSINVNCPSNAYNNYSTNSNLNISSDAIIGGTFSINSGNIVTISSNVSCLKNSKFIVLPGGKLIINGATISNLNCTEDLWDGIYVVGDTTKRQLAQYQGTLEVKNGSLIENAKHAIVTWDGTDYATSGGIVKCSNSTFRNNALSIEFLEYTNHTSGGYETNNVSFATKCTFVVDDNNLFASNSEYFDAFVTLMHVKGLSFNGSTFRDARIPGNNQTQTKGIWSFGAGYTVSEHCTMPYSNMTPCTCNGIETRPKFSRLKIGIFAQNDGTTYNFSANHAIFDTCYKSVFIMATNNCKVTRSDFNQNTHGFFTGNSSAGVYLDNSTGYTIEANNFATTYTTCPSGFLGSGVYVFGSGTYDNTIYRNNITNLYYGIKSDGSNEGLQLQCNEFSGTFGADINVSGALSGSQGSSSKSAGNKFISGVKKINSPSTYITYYHSGANNSSNVYCPNNSSATIVRVPNITANDCASTICIPFPAYPPTPKSAPENDDITLYESLKQIYESRLTEYTAAGYDFLLENFDVNDADIVATARLMQDTLISLSRAMAEIANRNLNAILADSVLDRESLNGWYDRINTTTAKYSLANSYFETGEYSLARQELAAIPQRFTLSSVELAEYNNFCDYNALRESVYASGRNYAQLTEDEIAELEAIADLNTGVSSAYANSVLCFFYGICQEIEEPDFDNPQMTNKNAVATVEENSERESLAVYVYPNPADEELNILLNSMPEGTTTIEFHDVTGRLVLSEEIKSANTSINISSLRQGVYMYRIVNGDNVIARDRIVKK